MLFHVSLNTRIWFEGAHVLYAELAHRESCLVDTGGLGTRS